MPKYLFESCCPHCGPAKSSVSTWEHHNCGGTLYIWDDCDIQCGSCSKYKNILDWKFSCWNHWGEFLEPNIQCVIRSISSIAQMSNIPYKIFEKMEKKIKEEGRRRGLNLDDD